MKPLVLTAASALALAAGACNSGPPRARAALDCPPTSGSLNRTAVAPDGKSCSYRTSRGGEVTLQLIPVQGSVAATLQAIEANLLAQRRKPAPDGGAGAAKAPARTADSDRTVHEKVTSEVDKAVSEAMADAKQAQAEASRQAGSAGVSEDEATTHVNLPGVHITAHDDSDGANVQVGPISINAGDDAATVRVGPRDVRMRGEALNPRKRGVRATFLYRGADLPDGYRFVGYEAGGPKGGPLAVAIVKSKAPDASRIGSDVTRLVRRNGGV